MARIRTIKPEFFTSLTIDSLTLEQRLTFIGLWTYVDDEGRCKYDPRLIRAALWPLSERTAEDVDDDIRGLTEASLITHYVVSERSFLAVNSWVEHQRINRKTASRLPAPSDGEIVPLTRRNDRSRRTHGGLSEEVHRERKGTGNREGKPIADAIGSAEPPAEPTDITPRVVVGAWVEAMTANGVTPTQSMRNAVGKTAKELLATNDPGRVMAAARQAGARGFATIDRELTAMAGRPLRAVVGGSQFPAPGYDEHGNPLRDPKTGVWMER
jgi:hypothetical protein